MVFVKTCPPTHTHTFSCIPHTVFFFPRSKLWPPLSHTTSPRPLGCCSEGLEHEFASLNSTYPSSLKREAVGKKKLAKCYGEWRVYVGGDYKDSRKRPNQDLLPKPTDSRAFQRRGGRLESSPPASLPPSYLSHQELHFFSFLSCCKLNPLF